MEGEAPPALDSEAAAATAALLAAAALKGEVAAEGDAAAVFFAAASAFIIAPIATLAMPDEPCLTEPWTKASRDNSECRSPGFPRVSAVPRKLGLPSSKPSPGVGPGKNCTKMSFRAFANPRFWS